MIIKYDIENLIISCISIYTLIYYIINNNSLKLLILIYYLLYIYI